MSRLVPYAGSYQANRTAATAATAAAVDAQIPSGAPPSKEDRLEAIAKYIPAEILAFYLPAMNAVEMIKGAAAKQVAHIVILLVAWALVPVYFKWIGKGDPRTSRQIIVSSIAFPIWVYATHRNVGVFGLEYQEPYALLALGGFSLLTAFVLPKR